MPDFGSGWVVYAPGLAIARDELQESYSRASGPGGQHVNTTSSAVELRFNAAQSPNLPDIVKSRLRPLAGRRMTNDGIIVIRAERHRSQERNRTDALDRLLVLLRDAATPQRIRRPTKPTHGSQLRRLASKSQRSGIKAHRRKQDPSDQG